MRKFGTIITWCVVFGLFYVAASFADDIKVDTSPQAVEAAYQQVRQGDALHVADLKETAEGLLVKLINAAVATGDFIADQIPIVIKELLTYYTALYAFRVALCLPFIYLGWWMFTRITKRFSKDGKYAPEKCEGLRWFCLLPFGVALVICIAMIPNLLMITLAPRVWLIEYAASLVK